MKFNSQILFAVFTWALLILKFGYRFGSDDQIELLPYALFLNNPSLYPHDLFIHGLHAAVPNERTFAAYMLLPFINHLEAACLFLHFISTLILVIGLENLASRFIKRKWLARVCIIVSLIPFANVTLGSVVTYSEMYQASFLSGAVVLWGILAFLDRRYLAASLILSGATFIHLLEGLDVMIVLSCILLIQTFVLKQENAKSFFIFISLYLFTAGIYLLMNWQSKQFLTSGISSDEYYNIIFRFRLAHHYMLSHFPLIKTILFFLLSVVAIAFFQLKSRKLFLFSVISLFGMLIYAFLTEEYQHVFIASFQFFKLAQWLKYLGLIAAFAIAESLWVSSYRLPTKIPHSKSVQGLLTVLTLSIILFFPSLLPSANVYQIGKNKDGYDVIQICKAVKSAFPNDVLFIQPLLCSEVKFYTQRSSYIDFKAAPRNGQGMKAWNERLAEVYGLDYRGSKRGFEVVEDADNHYYHLPAETLLKLKDKGVTHILTRKEFPPSTGSLILSNSTYAVYQL